MSRSLRFGLVFALACSRAAPPPATAPSAAAPGAGEASAPEASAPEASTHGDAHVGAAHGAETHDGHAGFHKDFSDAKAFSAHFDDPARDAWQRPEEVLDLLGITPGSVVADLGAGTGYFVSGLARRVGARGQVLALDVEPQMINFLTQRIEREKLGNVRAVLVAPDGPGLAPSSVSRVLIVNTWHHIDARQSYAEKLRTALAPGGEVWVVDFTLESDLGPPARHRLSAEQVVSELEQAGLHAAAVTESLPKQYIVRAVR